MVFLKEAYAHFYKNNLITVCEVFAESIISYERIQETDISGDYSPCGECILVVDDTAPGISALLSVTSADYNKLQFHVAEKWSDFTPSAAHPNGTDAGRYYVNSITHDEANGTVNILGYDVLYKLGTSEFNGINVTDTPRTYESIAETVCSTADVRVIVSADFPDAMSGTTTGYIPASTLREALRLIGQAAGCTVFVNELGQVTYKDPVRDSTALPDVVLTAGDVVDDSISESVNSVKPYVSVSYYKYTKQTTQIALASKQGILIPANSTGVNAVYLNIPYDEYPAVVKKDAQGIVVGTGIVCGNNNIVIAPLHSIGLVQYDWNPDSVDLVLQNATANDITTWINVFGYKYEETENEKTHGEKTAYTKTEKIENKLITNGNDAYIACRFRAEVINGNKRYQAEVFGTRVNLVDLVQMPNGVNIIADKISVKLTANDYKYTIEGYKYEAF